MGSVKLILHFIGVVLIIPWCAIMMCLFVLACDLLVRICELLFLRLCEHVKSIITQTKILVMTISKKIAHGWNKFLNIRDAIKDQIKKHWQKYDAAYIVIIRLVIIITLTICYLHHSLSYTYEWRNLIDGNHWGYVVLVVIEVIYAFYLIYIKISKALDEARLLLQESWQNFSGDINQIGHVEVWNQLLSSNSNLFNSIWVVFILILFPCALCVDGLAILVQIHIGLRDVLNISMAVTSVTLALFSLAFAKTVQRKTDDNLAKLAQKIDHFSSWYEDNNTNGSDLVKKSSATYV